MCEHPGSYPSIVALNTIKKKRKKKDRREGDVEEKLIRI